MPRLLNLDSGEVVSFRSHLRVGRAPENDLWLDLSSVSKRHAVLELVDGEVYVEDLRSTNGTRVQGRSLASRRKLAPNDRIQFGPNSDWRLLPDTDSSAPEPIGPAVRLADSGRLVPVTHDRFVIGASPSADLRLDGPDVPTVAGVLFLEQNRWWWTEVSSFGQEPDRVEDGAAFQAAGRELCFVARPASRGLCTTRDALQEKHYDIHLKLSARDHPDRYVSIRRPGTPVLRISCPIHRFALLELLARAVIEGGDRPHGAWVKDTDLRSAIYGRRDVSINALPKLIHDTRAMFVREGLDPCFIEKAAGATRLRLEPDWIELTDAG